MSHKDIKQRILKQNIGVLLRLPSQKLTGQLHQRLAEAGYGDIRPAHGHVFQHIHLSGSRLTDLAERAQLTKQSMAYLVESLEKDGYVERIPDPADGRARLIRLTERGRQALGAADQIFKELEAEIAERMGFDNLAKLRQLLLMLTVSVDEKGCGE